jgi:hypothetical protein
VLLGGGKAAVVAILEDAFEDCRRDAAIVCVEVS